MRRAAAVPVALGVVLGAAACGGGGSTTTVTLTRTVTHTKTVRVTTSQAAPSAAACAGNDLSGTFSLVPGSAGAGQIVYVLRLRNTSSSDCFVSGIPNVLLLDEQGARLPTSVVPSHRGQATAAMVVLAPGDAATAEARFSPDVPGTGDQQGPSCEPKAFTLHVTFAAGGSVEAPVQPPTPVCERGQLQFDLLSRAS